MKDHPLQASHDDDRERGRYMGGHKPEISGNDIADEIEKAPDRLSHADCRLWELASTAVFSPDTSDAVKQIALSIREVLRLQSKVEELHSIRAMLLVNFGPGSKNPIVDSCFTDERMDTETMLWTVLGMIYKTRNPEP